MEVRCDIPNEEKKLRYSMELGVFPVHFDDPRAWFLPEKIGQKQASQLSPPLWRAPKPVSHDKTVLAAVEQMREVVACLSVGDGMETDKNLKVTAATSSEVQNTANLMDEDADASNALALNATLTTAATNLKTVDNTFALSSVENNITMIDPADTVVGKTVEQNTLKEMPDGSKMDAATDATSALGPKVGVQVGAVTDMNASGDPNKVLDSYTTGNVQVMPNPTEAGLGHVNEQKQIDLEPTVQFY